LLFRDKIVICFKNQLVGKNGIYLENLAKDMFMDVFDADINKLGKFLKRQHGELYKLKANYEY
jgi:hypothetical protein